MVGEAVRSYYRADTKHIPTEWIYPWPSPETIGLTLATEEIARVMSVAPNSIAAKAEIKPGDEFTHLNGQRLTSIADVSWALHRSPESGILSAVIFRDGKELPIKIDLPSGWRLKTDISGRVGTWDMRAMVLGGLLLENLPAEEHAKRNLPTDSMALFVKYAGEYGLHAAAKKAGFRKDDVIVSLEGNDQPTTESELIGRLLQTHVPGDKVKAVVLRGRERIDLWLPIQ
jgi:S1-C subfamily serine protease